VIPFCPGQRRKAYLQLVYFEITISLHTLAIHTVVNILQVSAVQQAERPEPLAKQTIMKKKLHSCGSADGLYNSVKKILFGLSLTLLTVPGLAQKNILNYIKVYFTQPVDHSVSNGVNASYLNNVVFDTLAAYINRAKYTVDLAQYEYKTYTGDPIAAAVNAAYARGVKIRYIQDNSQAATNSGVSLLNASIHVLTSPTGSSYNIMHNKFVIIDEYSTDTTKAIVWTGSPDWDQAMSQGDYNNVIIFQSKVMARAFTHEFNIMWGDTTHGGAANATTSLFGPFKPNSGTHFFHIGGSLVELYFSPTDSVNNHIVSVINSAQTDLYCGMFTFTETTDATDIVNRKNAGVYAAAILDKYSSGTYTPYTTTLPTGLGANFTGYNSSNTLYHNKYVIVDPSAHCQDPLIFTGSHNWTATADSKNDENTVIVHNDTIANLYLQSFVNDFKVISGHALTPPVDPCPSATGITEQQQGDAFRVYPNPFSGELHLLLNKPVPGARIVLYDALGKAVYEEVSEGGTDFTLYTQTLPKGLYIVAYNDGANTWRRKVIH
jgi:phosphatidylserine/phosphatidylglycerophosphate/cardiolipin synthase-like enzyme